jgi:hypothetical protein
VELLYVVAGVMLGGLIAYYFFRRASSEVQAEADALRRETENARHYFNGLISYLENAGQIEVVRDEDGRPIQTKIDSEEEAGRLTTATRHQPPELPKSPEDRS